MQKTMKITYAIIIATLAVAMSSSYMTAPVKAAGAGLKFVGPITCQQVGTGAGAYVTCSGNVSGAGTGATATVTAHGTSISGCRTGSSDQGNPPGQQTPLTTTGTSPITASREGGSTPFTVSSNPVSGPTTSCPSSNMTPYFTVTFTTADVCVSSPNKVTVCQTVNVQQA